VFIHVIFFQAKYMYLENNKNDNIMMNNFHEM